MTLLDTHVLLWLLQDDARLGPETRTLLAEATVLHASAASMWEIAIKSSRGRLVVSDELPQQVSASGLQWLDITPRHAWAVRAVEGLPHPDPFDRMLVAQALVESMPFVTADRAILGADVDSLRTIDARA